MSAGGTGGPQVVAGRDPASGGGLAVTIRDGRIAAVSAADVPADAPWLAPGLIDLQVNGYAGLDLNDGAVTPARVRALVDALAAVGVTTSAPTLITAGEASLLRALAAVAEAVRADPVVRAAVPFVHVEGPAVAPEDGPRGAHPREHVRPLDLAEVDRWQAAGEGLVGLVTLSPHWPGTEETVRGLVARGIRVSLGHTAATGEEIGRAVAAGATLSTHLGNGAAALLPRHPNVIWSQLAEDRLTAGFIADGHHLGPAVLKAMLRAKGPGRAFLVSDTVGLGGMAPGLYDQPIGGRVELSADGRLSLAGTPYLAGAARPLKDGVAFVAALGDHDLAAALALATEVPGRIVGDRGRIAVGMPADLIAFDWAPGAASLTIRAVWAAGEARPVASAGAGP